ncbi:MULTISPECIES: tRNA (adenosine(37)-N6)-dimethylallyltransferase MiaA [unclassified Nocardioides]|uniref:tRNA (adenosine(37)-N6)-dimethylallyltransferase MiaA n=1 Tax=unclassified Nocardioides TaxID=2615069 RepID=UPI000702526D|nr:MULTISPECIES: tRNA (adenosine(37)-N6)-dimethylallyltransferase MiaA [unclassified Nocardioides]KRC59654.1 tRNA dimethylallyltransferase [Nocardioides sp. Root79]KRC68521.1 tRNA dimethylallyltransferase [Nocardioides sp. Root240]
MASAATTTASPVVAIVGPTASGKTSLSLDLAAALGGEVVNTDAMQVYRGMDIGTAKLPPAERRGIPHHLLDTLDVREPATVAQFQAWARAAIADIRGRGATPVLVGGSALYTRAILDRFDFPGTDAAVRERYEAELEEVGSAVLHARLRELDPVSAERIEVENGRRVVRALEVIELTGQPFSARLPVQEYVDPATVQVGVAIERDVLEERIRLRVRQMFDEGLLEEVERLLPAGLAEGRTASLAIGYRQAMAVLAGEMSLDEAIERTVIATRKFARRQMAWWRNDPRITWVAHDDPDRVAQALAAVRDVMRPGRPDDRNA